MLANGQVAATATAILSNPPTDVKKVNGTFTNVGGSSETLVLTMTLSGGTARRIRRETLAANEMLLVRNLPMDQSAILLATTSNASSVDYVLSHGDDGPIDFVSYDANGAIKSGSSSVNGSLSLTADVTLQNSSGTSHEAWDASDVSTLWASSPSQLEPDRHQRCYEIFDDFTEFDPTASVGNWVVVEDDAACTQALRDDQAGGKLLLTNKATTDDNAQQISYVSAPFLLAADKHLWFEARFKCAAGATQIDLIAGLCALAEDMTGVADNRFADGIGFFKSDGATTLQFGASKNGTDTGTNTSVGTLTTGWHTVGFYVNGVTSATPYVDGVAGTAITATFCDDEALAPIFMVRNGDGTDTQTLEIDYVKVVQLR